MMDRRCHLKENRRDPSKVGEAHQKKVGARHREFNSSDVQEKATTFQSAEKTWAREKHRVWLCEGQKQEANLTGR